MQDKSKMSCMGMREAYDPCNAAWMMPSIHPSRDCPGVFSAFENTSVLPSFGDLLSNLYTVQSMA